MARDETEGGAEGGERGASVARLPGRSSLRAVPHDGPHDRAGERGADPEGVARATLATLRQRHRDLDLAIEALQARGTDPFTVRRLKKRKLALRDRIAAIEDELTPDIIA